MGREIHVSITLFCVVPLKMFALNTVRKDDDVRVVKRYYWCLLRIWKSNNFIFIQESSSVYRHGAVEKKERVKYVYIFF